MTRRTLIWWFMEITQDALGLIGAGLAVYFAISTKPSIGLLAIIFGGASIFVAIIRLGSR